MPKGVFPRKPRNVTMSVILTDAERYKKMYVATAHELAEERVKRIQAELRLAELQLLYLEKVAGGNGGKTL